MGTVTTAYGTTVRDLVVGGGASNRFPVECSFFQHGVCDVHPQHWQGTWGRLVDAFGRNFPCDQALPDDEAKKTQSSICNATFQVGKPRRRQFVAKSHLLIKDFDNTRDEFTGGFHLDAQGRPTNRPMSRKVRLEKCVQMEEVVEALQRAGVTAYLWSTWSSTPEHPRFRVVLPLVQSVPGELWGKATELAIERLGMLPFRHAIDLPVLRNPAALGFLPGGVAPEKIVRWFVDGDPLWLPPSQILKAEVPKSHLAPWQHDIVRGRAIVPGDRWWRAYLDQGRLTNYQHLDLADILAGLGCEVGQASDWGGGIKRRCTCPWHGEHSGGVDDDAAVIFQRPGQWPGWHCSHSGHAHMGLRDILELAWGRP